MSKNLLRTFIAESIHDNDKFINEVESYEDNSKYQFKIDNDKLSLIKRPPEHPKGNLGLPKVIAQDKVNAVVTNLLQKYPGDQKLKALLGNTKVSAKVVDKDTPKQADKQTDSSGVSMYGAKIVKDEKNYTEYRVYSNGLIKRFGVMKDGSWKMDDPAIDIPVNKRSEIATQILSGRQYTSNELTPILQKIAAGKLTGDLSQSSPAYYQQIFNLMRRALIASGAPIAYVGFADFLLGRTSAWTENDLPENYRNDLAKVAKYALTRKNSKYPGAKFGEILHTDAFVYGDFWKNASILLGQGEPGSPMTGANAGMKGTGTVEALEFFLGGMVVTQEGNDYVIKDIYDFDDYFVSPESFDEMLEFLGSMRVQSGLYNMIRKAATYRQSTGYTGYPIEIRLPVSLASDFRVKK